MIYWIPILPFIIGTIKIFRNTNPKKCSICVRKVFEFTFYRKLRNEDTKRLSCKERYLCLIRIREQKRPLLEFQPERIMIRPIFIIERFFRNSKAIILTRLKPLILLHTPIGLIKFTINLRKICQYQATALASHSHRRHTMLEKSMIDRSRRPVKPASHRL